MEIGEKMSSIVYSGGSIINTTFTCTTGTRAEIVTGLSGALVSAGWTSLGGGIYKSGTTPSPKSNSIRVKINDPGSGNCAQVNIQNDAGDRVGNPVYLLPGVGKVFRVIACQYNFFIFVEGSTSPREYAAGGTLFIPDFLNGLTNGSFGWLQGNGINDTDNIANRQCFRTRLTCSGSQGARCTVIRNNQILNIENTSDRAFPNLLMPNNGRTTSNQYSNPYKWADDSIGITEAIMCFGILTQSDESKRQGLIHNCLVSSDAYAADTVLPGTFDGHHWYGITNNNVGTDGDYQRGTLFVAID